MRVYTANYFSRPPYTTTIELMYRYQRYGERAIEFSDHMDSLRDDIQKNMAKFRNLEYYRDPYEIDLKC
jgi:hypothetical protein